MKSILVVISQPSEDEQSGQQRWARATTILKSKLGPPKSSELLGEGCLCIHDESALPMLAAALSAAEANQLSYRVIFIDGTSEWNRTFKPQRF